MNDQVKALIDRLDKAGLDVGSLRVQEAHAGKIVRVELTVEIREAGK